jgi:hypothetical protein
MIATIRVLLGMAGLWCAYYGISMILPYRPADLLSVVIWFVGGIVLHDFVFAPLCVIVGLGARRLVPRVWWAPLAYGTACTVVLVALAVPVLVPHNTFGNSTVVDRNYPLGLGIALAVVWIMVLLSIFRIMRHRRTVSGS